jgi:phage/plasmid-associated DNA primase
MLEDQMKEDELEKAKATEAAITSFIFKLGQESFKANVVNQIIRNVREKTLDNNINITTFDSNQDCVGFLDGVYDFTARKLYRGSTASQYYITKTVGYAYEDVENVSDDVVNEFNRFLRQIFPQEAVRNFILKLTSTSIKGVPQQHFVIHYNIGGTNGKTTFFNLVKAVFGEYFIKCHEALLYPIPNQAREDLISLMGMKCVCFPESNSRIQKINAAFVKEVTEGDELSAETIYGPNQNFTFRGLAHLLCNKIPELDDYDGDIARRLVCIPYKSTFVYYENEVNEATNKYLADIHVDMKFNNWRYAMMKLLIDMSDTVVERPNEV